MVNIKLLFEKKLISTEMLHVPRIGEKISYREDLNNYYSGRVTDIEHVIHKGLINEIYVTIK